MKFKTFDVKATEDGAGFTGYASVFDNIDSYGDMMRKGAFEESLKEYSADGAGVPVYWAHRMDDPMMNIGITVRAVEDDHGLLVEVKLGEETAVEKHVRRLLKQGRVKQMSFAFDYLEASWIDIKDGDSYYEVRKVKLHEVSVVPVGANQETEILSAKAIDALRKRKDAGDSTESDADESLAEAFAAFAKGVPELIEALSGSVELLAKIAEVSGSEIPDDDADTSPGAEEKSVPLSRRAEALFRATETVTAS